jgi:hypothetical protein
VTSIIVYLLDTSPPLATVAMLPSPLILVDRSPLDFIQDIVVFAGRPEELLRLDLDDRR